MPVRQFDSHVTTRTRTRNVNESRYGVGHPVRPDRPANVAVPSTLRGEVTGLSPLARRNRRNLASVTRLPSSRNRDTTE